jgi:hypothetical protein
LIKRLAAVAVCATALVTLAATQASAYPDRGSGTLCSSGPSGTACAHVETDIGSGHIRARLAVQARSGKRITTNTVQLEELTTERSTGQQSAVSVAYTPKRLPSTGSVVSVVAGPLEEECDSKLATFQWRADVSYTTSASGGLAYLIITPWYSGAC